VGSACAISTPRWHGTGAEAACDAHTVRCCAVLSCGSRFAVLSSTLLRKALPSGNPAALSLSRLQEFAYAEGVPHASAAPTHLHAVRTGLSSVGLDGAFVNHVVDVVYDGGWAREEA